mgnify:CR=1 FL=1|jgi:hypothetical protein
MSHQIGVSIRSNAKIRQQNNADILSMVIQEGIEKNENEKSNDEKPQELESLISNKMYTSFQPEKRLKKFVGSPL